MKKELHIFTSCSELFGSPYMRPYITRHDLHLQVGETHRTDILMHNYAHTRKNVTLTITHDPLKLLIVRPRFYTDSYEARSTATHQLLDAEHGVVTIQVENVYPSATGHFYILSFEIVPKDIGSSIVSLEGFEEASIKKRARRPQVASPRIPQLKH